MPPYFRPQEKYKDVKDDESKLSDYLKEMCQHAIDYIAGMMDTFAIEEFERFFHKKFDEIDLEDLETINQKLKERAKKNVQKS